MPRSARDPLLVALAAVAAHATALAGRFLWLDHGDLEQGYALAPLRSLGGLFVHGFARTGFYRPLVGVSLSLDAATQLGPAMFHVTNLGWHALAAALVVLVGAELGLERRAALLAGLLFAVHPVTSLVADAISYRADAMVAVGLLAAILAHRRGQGWLAALAILLASLSKETGLVLAPVLLALTSTSTPRMRVLLAELASWSLALGLRLAFAPAWHVGQPPLPLAEQVMTRSGALVRSALALVAPVDPSICDDTPILGLSSPVAWLGVALAVGLGVLALRRRGPARLLVVALLPALMIVPAPRFWSPHYLYLPLAFGAMAVAPLALRRRALTWAAAALLPVLGLASLNVGRRYHDDLALFGPEVAERPMCREGWLYVGDARRPGDPRAAVDAYRHALEPTPGHLAYVDRAAAWQNLGATELTLDELPEAEKAFRAALALASGSGARRELTYDLAATRLAMGHPEETDAMLAAETARPDALPEALSLRARALEVLGRAQEAAVLRNRIPGGGR